MKFTKYEIYWLCPITANIWQQFQVALIVNFSWVTSKIQGSFVSELLRASWHSAPLSSLLPITHKIHITKPWTWLVCQSINFLYKVMRAFCCCYRCSKLSQSVCHLFEELSRFYFSALDFEIISVLCTLFGKIFKKYLVFIF